LHCDRKVQLLSSHPPNCPQGAVVCSCTDCLCVLSLRNALVMLWRGYENTALML
jgi:hypothetical protein